MRGYLDVEGNIVILGLQAHGGGIAARPPVRFRLRRRAALPVAVQQESRRAP